MGIIDAGAVWIGGSWHWVQLSGDAFLHFHGRELKKGRMVSAFFFIIFCVWRTSICAGGPAPHLLAPFFSKIGSEGMMV